MTGTLPRRSRAPLGLLLFLARKSLAQDRLITALMVIAVAAGVTFQIPNTGNLAGYRNMVLEQGVAAGFGDVRVRPRQGQFLEEADELATRMRAVDGVVEAVPLVVLAGAVGDGARGFRNSVVVGVDGRATRKPYMVRRGVDLQPGDDRGLLMGEAIAHHLGVSPGDEVQLRVMLGGDLDGGSDIGRYTMIVRGTAVGSFVAPAAVVVDRGFLVGELGRPGQASMLVVHAAAHDAAAQVAARINAAHEVDATGWQEDDPFIRAAVASSRTIGALSHTMIALGVLIPVWALLYIHVLHRRRQIALLAAAGFGRGTVFTVFLAQAALIGLLGCAIGVAAGWGLVHWFTARPIFDMEGFTVVPLVGLRTFAVPVLLVLGATLAAGVLPAWRASRVEPVTAIRED